MRSLAALRFLSEASEASLARLATRVHWIDLNAGECLCDMGDESRDVFILVAGSVRVLLRTSSGEEMILGDLTPEAVIGEMAAIDGRPRGANVTALSNSTVCRVPPDAFLDLLAHEPKLALRIMRQLSSRLRLANAKLFENAVLTVRLRLMSELLRLARPSSRAGVWVVSPPPVQSDLAARIGVRREAVSREMKELEATGLIARERGGIFIHDQRRMALELGEIGFASL